MTSQALQVARLLIELHELCPRITPQGVIALLLVTDSPGISMSDLGKKMKCGQSTVSRNVGILGAGYRLAGKMTEGYGLVETWNAPWDTRVSLVQLTKLGKKTMEALLAKHGQP